MNVLGSKDELVDTSFSVKFRLQHMQTCSDCQQYLAEIDGLCAFCRSVQRLTSELRRLGPCLRGWAIDQTRVWVSIVQEEAGKWEKGAEAARKAAEAAATSKAASPVTFTQPVSEAGDQPAKEEVKSEKREPLAPKGREVSPGKISSPSEGIPVENEELLPPAVKQEDIEEEPRRKEKKTKEDIAAPEERKEKKDTKTKKEKAKKKSKKSRSRPRRSRRDSRRPRRDRNSRPRSRGRESPRRGDCRPPEPANPPSSWRGYSQHRDYFQSYYLPPGNSDRYDANWGENKGQKKRKKQQEWRDAQFEDRYYRYR